MGVDASSTALADRRARLAADAAPALLWSCGPDRRFDWFNAAWERFTGRSVEELQRNGWRDLLHAEDAERWQGIFDASLEALSAYSLDYRLRRHDGTYRWVSDSATPRFDPDGAWSGYVGALVDVDERRRQEERLADRVRTLRLADRREDEFLSVLSHELRNPLAPIGNAASVLRTLEGSEPVVARLREILERQVGRLERLVADLIDTTRAARGRISFIARPVSIERVVHDAAHACAEALDAAGHRLQIEIPPDVPPIIGDAARLVDSLRQVIGNAIRFRAEPGVIAVTVHDRPDALRIVVRDDGQGISPDLLPHVFDLFARQHTVVGPKHRGAGVGLTLARRIVLLHGGRIEIASDGIGHGTTVTIDLPRTADASKATGTAGAAAQRVSSSADGAVAGASSPLEYSFKRL